jgi:uncharacterized membrane protein
MSWIIYAIGAMFAAAGSDLFRKVGSNLSDPFLANLLSQIGSLSTAVILFLLFSRKFEHNTSGITSAILTGVFISVSTALFFKALSVGPGVATVAPVIRVGGVLLVAVLGIIIFREKLTWNIVLGIVLACSGVYLLFSNK